MMDAHVVLGASARLVIPISAVFALVLLVNGAPGDGVGMRAGLMFSLAMVVHALVFGVAAAISAFPTWAARGTLASGAAIVSFAAASPNYRFSGQFLEAGLFATVVAATALVMAVMIGRAPALRDGG